MTIELLFSNADGMSIEVLTFTTVLPMHRKKIFFKKSEIVHSCLQFYFTGVGIAVMISKFRNFET